MMAKGLTMEQALIAMEVIETEAVTRIEAKRASARSRQRKHRLVTQNVTPQTPANVGQTPPVTLVTPVTPVTPVTLQASLARVEDNSTTTDLTGKGKKEFMTRETRVRAHRLPPDFKPSEPMRVFARSAGLSEAQIDAEGEAMRDWSLSSPSGAKLDWEATWRGWVRRKTDGNGGNGHGYGHRNAKSNSLTDAAERVIVKLEQQFGVPPSNGGEIREEPRFLLSRN
jgi:hypothetical protein